MLHNSMSRSLADGIVLLISFAYGLGQTLYRFEAAVKQHHCFISQAANVTDKARQTPCVLLRRTKLMYYIRTSNARARALDRGVGDKELPCARRFQEQSLFNVYQHCGSLNG